MSNFACPCDSEQSYSSCCQPYHAGKSAPTADVLMRSRYCAFVLHNIEYIINTTAPFQQGLLDKQVITDWSVQTDWAGLHIIKHTPKLGKRHAQVEFEAFFHAGNDKQAHHELSTFVNVGSLEHPHWYFLDPTVLMSLTQKQPCPCGSGDKYKRCCGRYL